jgi:hypothetical protein
MARLLSVKMPLFHALRRVAVCREVANVFVQVSDLGNFDAILIFNSWVS